MTYCVTHYVIKKNHVDITLSSEEIKIPLDVFYKYHIHTGDCFDSHKKQQILEDASYYWCLDKAYKMLKTPKTIHELKEKLHEYPVHIVKQVIQALTIKKYVNDEAYMKLYHELRPSVGPKKLMYVFKQKGIQHEIIDTFIQSIDESKGLHIAIEKLLKKSSTKSYQKQKEWLYQNLISKGFSTSLITSILDTYLEKDTLSELQHLKTLFHKTEHKLQGNRYEKCQMWIKKATSKGFSYHDAKQLCEGINENLDQW